MNGFEKEENLEWFYDYATYIFKEYSSKVKIWVTMNEIINYAGKLIYKKNRRWIFSR